MTSNYLQELPNLTKCVRLEKLYLRTNELKNIPSFFINLHLKDFTGIKGFDRAKTKATLTKFMQSLHKSTLPAAKKEQIFHLFVNNKKKVKANLGIKDLVDSLSFSNEVVRDRAMGYLLNWKGRTLVEHPIKKGADIFLIGDTNLKRTTIKSRLEKNGSIYTTTLQATTTHVVLGNNPKNYEAIEKWPVAFLTEQDLALLN